MNREIKHGYAAYANHRCRCETCRKDHREWQLAYRHRTREPESLAHGTNSTYTNYGCRCDECKAAAASYWQAYRDRKVAAS